MPCATACLRRVGQSALSPNGINLPRRPAPGRRQKCVSRHVASRRRATSLLCLKGHKASTDGGRRATRPQSSANRFRTHRLGEAIWSCMAMLQGRVKRESRLLSRATKQPLPPWPIACQLLSRSFAVWRRGKFDGWFVEASIGLGMFISSALNQPSPAQLVTSRHFSEVSDGSALFHCVGANGTATGGRCSLARPLTTPPADATTSQAQSRAWRALGKSDPHGSRGAAS